MMEQKPTIPNAVASLVLGICSIMTSILFVGLVLGIIGIALSGTGNRIYRENPSEWSGYGMLSAGRILSIIGTIFSGVYIFIILIIVLFAASAATATIFNI